MMQSEFIGVSEVDMSKYSEIFVTFARSISNGKDEGKYQLRDKMDRSVTLGNH